LSFLDDSLVNKNFMEEESVEDIPIEDFYD
jgi:hypothetical protein